MRIGVLSADRLRRSRRIGIVICVALAAALPGVDPVTTTFQAIPLLFLFEASIRLAGYFEKRWAAQAAAEEAAALGSEGARRQRQPSRRPAHGDGGLLGRLGAAGRRRADPAGWGGSRGRRRIVAVGPATELEADERHHHDDCAIIPGFVNAHTHLEYAVYAGFGDGPAVRRVARLARLAQAPARL